MTRFGSDASRFGSAAVVTLALLGCNQQPRPALIVVTHGATDAVRVAQSHIVEATGEGESVIQILRDQVRPETIQGVLERAEWVTQQAGVAAVVGHPSSSSSLAAAPIYREAGIPFLVPTATTPLLDDLPGVFPLAPNDSSQGAVLAEFAQRRFDARTVTILFVNDEYGRGLRLGLIRGFERLGIRVLEELPVLPTSNLEVMVEAMLARVDPEIVVAAVRAPAVWDIARQVHVNAPGTPVLAGDGAYADHRIPEDAGPSAGSLYLSVFWHPHAADSNAVRFVEEYHQQTGQEAEPSDAMVYDAIMLAATAIHQVGANRAAVSRYLETLGVTRPPYQGITGEIDFRGDRSGPLMIVTPRDGVFVPYSYEH